MSEPTPAVRAVTYERDEHRCVACGTLGPLTYQHRAAVGAGGSAFRPRLEEGVSACWNDNVEFEGALQSLALACGWKVPRWVLAQGLMVEVPVFYRWEGRWCRLTTDGRRVPIFRSEALRMMRAVYGPSYEEPKERAA